MFIKVKVFPNSKEEKIVEKENGKFEVKIKAKPVDGLANREVIKLLSSYFKIPESKIKLIKGFKERNKIFEIKNWKSCVAK